MLNFKGLRVVRSSKTCLITNMESSFDFSKLALDFRHYTKTKKRWDMNFKISVKIGKKSSLSKARAANECEGRSLERIVDVDVTEEMFDKLYRGNMITVGPRTSSPSAESCQVSRSRGSSARLILCLFCSGYLQPGQTRPLLGNLYLRQPSQAREDRPTSVTDSPGPRLLSQSGRGALPVWTGRPLHQSPAVR